nr:MAG TPA: hypothetical protein [Caudoviricetes sp.]
MRLYLHLQHYLVSTYYHCSRYPVCLRACLLFPFKAVKPLT